MTYNQSYKKLVEQVLITGTWVESRNSQTLSIPFYSFIIKDLANDHKLLLRKQGVKGIEGEFKTLMSKTPLVNSAQFRANSCNYWEANAGPNGELRLDYYDELHAQLPNLVANIKSDPYSRRHKLELWNHKNVSSGVLSLPCCWTGFTISILENKLHMTFNTRSQDLMLGTQADVYIAWLFMKYLSEETGYATGDLMYTMSNVHLYEEHIPGAKELLTRTESDFDKKLSFELKA